MIRRNMCECGKIVAQSRLCVVSQKADKGNPPNIFAITTIPTLKEVNPTLSSVVISAALVFVRFKPSETALGVMLLWSNFLWFLLQMFI